MKSFLSIIILTVFCLPLLTFAQAVVKGDEKYEWYLEQYPYLEGRNKIYSLETEFRWPEGYKRIDPSNLNSFQKWITDLPLWRKGKPVGAYGKGVFLKVGEFSRTIQLPWRTVHFTHTFVPIQLLGEFLLSRRQEYKLEIAPKKGEPISYQRWLNSEVKYDQFGNMTSAPSIKRQPSEDEFNRFLKEMAINVTCKSLLNICELITEEQIAPGDLFVAQNEQSRESLVYIIINILVNEQGQRLYVLATGCPEACDFHIPLFNNDQDYPWITLEEIKALGNEYNEKGFFRLKTK